MTENQYLIPLTDHKAWNDALTGLEFGPAHMHWYNEALSRDQPDDFFLYLYRNELGGNVALPFRRRYYDDSADIFSPYGNGGFIVSGNIDGFWDAHKLFMRQQGIVCGHVSLNQISPAQHLLPEYAVEYLKPVFLVDTSQDLDQISQRFGQNNRRHVRNWHAREDAEINEDQHVLRNVFLDLYPSFAERMGIEPRHRLANVTLCALLEKSEKIKLFGVQESSGEISFVRCFFFTEHSAEAFLEASTEDGRRHSRVIYWTAYQWAHKAGIPKLNLSGGIKAGDGLEFFKKNLGGDRRALYRARLIYDDDVYAQLCRNKNVGPHLVPGEYFPPYRA